MRDSFAVRFRKKSLKILKGYQLYLLIFPAFLFFLVFCYFPMYGIQIAFKDFVATKGIWGSEWVGFKHLSGFLNPQIFCCF